MNYTFFRELQKKMKAATESFAGDKADEKAVFDAVFAPIAKEAGYEFSFEDMEELAKASGDGEISDDEATASAGGYFHYLGFTRLPKRDVFI